MSSVTSPRKADEARPAEKPVPPPSPEDKKVKEVAVRVISAQDYALRGRRLDGSYPFG